jgi:hypothetical protein
MEFKAQETEYWDEKWSLSLLQQLGLRHQVICEVE